MAREHDAFTCRQLILPLTTLKLSAKAPVSEALLRRRLLSLSEAAREALVGMILCKLGRRGLHSLTEDLFEGLKRALVHHPEATAIEVARVHAAGGSFMAADAWERVQEHRENTIRLSHEAVQYLKRTKRWIYPVASDRFHLAQLALQETTASDEDLTNMCGGVSVRRSDQDTVLLSEHGFIAGVQIALEVLKSMPPGPLVLCQSCCNPIEQQWHVCERCFEHILCARCARDDAAIEAHVPECARIRALVRQACEETRGHLGASPTHVTVLHLYKDAIMPVHIRDDATTDFPCPSSVMGRFLRAPCGAYIASLYEAPLMRFLAETSHPEPSDSTDDARTCVFEGLLQKIMMTYDSACLKPAEKKSEKQTRRRKEARAQRRRAARCIQLAARQLLARNRAAAVPVISVPDDAPPAAPEPEGDSSCVVCLERPRSVVLLPCRHLGLCETCAPGLATCPLCRETVSGTLVVFT